MLNGYRKFGMVKSFSWLCLYPLSLLYRFIIFIRRVLYKTKFVKTHQLPCKIIIVGNITVGGSGKTPMVKALAQYLQDKGCRVGIIVRVIKAY